MCQSGRQYFFKNQKIEEIFTRRLLGYNCSVFRIKAHIILSIYLYIVLHYLNTKHLKTKQDQSGHRPTQTNKKNKPLNLDFVFPIKICYLPSIIKITENKIHYSSLPLE